MSGNTRLWLPPLHLRGNCLVSSPCRLYSQSTGSFLWSQSVPTSPMGIQGMGMTADIVYALTYSSLNAFNAASGTPCWTMPIMPEGASRLDGVAGGEVIISGSDWVGGLVGGNWSSDLAQLSQ